MNTRFYNTLTHRLQDFHPIDPPRVSMYNCGPTVYDYAHIGNFRAFIFADVLRRFLELMGFQVHQVMNLTDVGHMTEDSRADGGGQDKMAVAMQRLALTQKKAGRDHAHAVSDPSDPYAVAEFYIRAFLDDAQSLGLKIATEYPAHMPRATAHIPQMQAMIAKLLARGHAYLAQDGAVYFSVEGFPDYGALSGNTLSQLREGAGGRTHGEHQSMKHHPADFLLWKPDPSHLMKWDSPWGVGYPGWHIECSAMATALLNRETIDIHTGGEDNIFPHHECEIAQSWGATGLPLARFWMHTRYLLVNGQKMSKSAGNFFTLRDLVSRGIDPVVVRYELLKAHYRSNMNFTFKGLEDSASAVRRLRDLQADLTAQAAGQTTDIDLSHPTLQAFAKALADDLNLGGALGELFKWLSDTREPAPQALAVLRKIDSVLGVLPQPEKTSDADALDDQIRQTCRDIDQARISKDFAKADRLRQQLTDAGYEVRNTAGGTTAQRTLI
jgi:cysteinyl-tRNA synthetase